MRPLRIAIAAFALAGGLPAQADDEKLYDEMWDAQHCSREAARRYAITSADGAPIVANAAFEKCWFRWKVFFEALDARSYANNPSDAANRTRRYDDEFKKMTIDDLTTLVFDTRAEAAGK